MLKNNEKPERNISETDKPEDGTYIIEGMIFGMIVGTVISLIWGIGSIVSIVIPGFGLVVGLTIGMCVKKKENRTK